MPTSYHLIEAAVQPVTGSTEMAMCGERLRIPGPPASVSIEREPERIHNLCLRAFCAKRPKKVFAIPDAAARRIMAAIAMAGAVAR